ncbi:hypothetical protein HN873_053961 [Arachis hypogaea]
MFKLLNYILITYVSWIILCTVPVFIAYIAPKELRGALTPLNQFRICGVVAVSFVIGNVLSWRTLGLIGLIPTCVLLLGLFIIPESPRWLTKRRRGKEFQAALRTLRGKDADISQVADEIQVPICFNKNSVTLIIFKDHAICTIIVYAAINAAAIVFIIVGVPETKGKSLEELQAAINA